jgi:hypothetical protein
MKTKEWFLGFPLKKTKTRIADIKDIVVGDLSFYQVPLVSIRGSKKMKIEYTKKIMRPATDRKTKPDEIEVKDAKPRQHNVPGTERKV